MEILKFTLEEKRDNKVSMPSRGKVLTAQAQNGKIVIWVLVDESIPHETTGRIFFTCFTGEEFTIQEHCDLLYISTVQLGHLVYHVFEKDYPF